MRDYQWHMPSSDQIQVVIDTLQHYIDLYPASVLNMHEMDVYSDHHACGTVHCHAGAYLIGHSDLNNKKIELDSTYSLGIDLMYKDLGFESELDLLIWAKNFPLIWGNKFGEHIFLDRMAFFSKDRPGGAENNQQIVDHWKEVKERVLAMEKRLQEHDCDENEVFQCGDGITYSVCDVCGKSLS